MVKGCEWVLLYNNSMYGNYLIPKAILDGSVLEEMVKSYRGIVVPESITFVCEFVKEEKLNRQWSPYIPVCLTYFIADIMRVSYAIEDAPETVDPFLMKYVLVNYFFVDYFMTRKPWVGYDEVKQELMKCEMVWRSSEAESLTKNFLFCGRYINEHFGVSTHPDSLTPAIYPWDFVDYFQPYVKEIESGKPKSEGRNYPS